MTAQISRRLFPSFTTPSNAGLLYSPTIAIQVHLPASSQGFSLSGIPFIRLILLGHTSGIFKHLLLVFLIQSVASWIFRLIAGVRRTMNIANTGGSLILLLIFLLAGFILPKTQIPNWWEWAHQVSPLCYGFKAFAINELYAPRWMNRLSSDNATPLGRAVLESLDIPTQTSWYWIGAAALLGFTVLFNVLFTLALMYFDAPCKPQAVFFNEEVAEMENQ